MKTLNLSELSKLASEIKQIQAGISQTSNKRITFEEEYKKAIKDLERYKLIEDITGKQIVKSLDEIKSKLEEKQNELQEYLDRKDSIEKQMDKGLSELRIQLSPDPKLNNGIAIFKLEESEVKQALDWLKELLGMEKELKITDVIFEQDKITVMNVKDEAEATRKLAQTVKTLRQLGKSKLGESSPAVIAIVNFVKKSKYQKVWEILADRGSIENKEIYNIIQATTRKDRVRVTAFLNKLKKHGVTTSNAKGRHTLTLLGKIVRLHYSKHEPIVRSQTASPENTKKKVQESDEDLQRSREKRVKTLNSWILTI